jgi:hypothetical protein
VKSYDLVHGADFVAARPFEIFNIATVPEFKRLTSQHYHHHDMCENAGNKNGCSIFLRQKAIRSQ